MPPKRATQKKKNAAKPKQKTKSTFKAPVAQSQLMRASVPKISRAKDSIVITHKEFFGSVGTASAPGTFEVTAYQVNPGNPSMFPWLSSQAYGWERYRFRKLIVHYIPRCATTQAGSLILSPDYDAADDVPGSEPIACSYADAVSAVPWAPVSLVLRPEPLAGGMKSKYVRVGALKPNLDVKMYDAASLFVCRDSAGGTLPIWGKLWVEYDVELITPHTIPIPPNSTFAAANQTTAQPAAAPFLGTSVAGNVVEAAGPIIITNPTPLVNSAVLNIEGLASGAQYMVQLIAESAGVGAIVSAAPTVVGAIVQGVTGQPNTWSPAAANLKGLMNELLIQASGSTASITSSWTGAAVRGAQLVLSMVQPDQAWVTL